MNIIQCLCNNYSVYAVFIHFDYFVSKFEWLHKYSHKILSHTRWSREDPTLKWLLPHLWPHLVPQSWTIKSMDKCTNNRPNDYKWTMCRGVPKSSLHRKVVKWVDNEWTEKSCEKFCDLEMWMKKSLWVNAERSECEEYPLGYSNIIYNI